MIFAVTALVVLGLVAVVLMAAGSGLSSGLLIIALFTAVFGGLAIAVARKAKTGTVAPARCGSCGGLISPNAPYCKHCGAATERVA